MRLVLHTVLYREALQFFKAWQASVESQQDQCFDIVLTLDGVSEEEVDQLLSTWMRERARLYVASKSGLAPVRGEAWERLVCEYEGIVMADADDILMPCRIGNARAGLLRQDVSVSALALIDQFGAIRLGEVWPGTTGAPETYILRSNDIGLSHTSYRADFLARLLPLPEDVRLVDWLLAQRTVALGGQISFEGSIGMLYRQHNANIVGLGSVTEQRVRQSTKLVGEHYTLLVDDRLVTAALGKELDRVLTRFGSFKASVVEGTEGMLTRYVSAFNMLNLSPLWWNEVAHPKLERQWTR